MLKRLWILLFFCSPPAAGGKVNGPVTIVLEFDQPYSGLSVSEMEHEAGTVLKRTGLTFDWILQESLQTDSEFGSLLIFKMKGRCAMDLAPQLIDERGPLGMAFVSDGQVLPFGEIECDRVKHTVQRVLPRGQSEWRDRLYGRALGRVVAHEMYHMLSGSTHHSKSGVTQATLTADELTSNHLDLVEPPSAKRGSRK